MDGVRIGIVGDHDPEYPMHGATNAALQISTRGLAVAIDAEWVGTDSVTPGNADVLSSFDGVWIAPGGPYRSLDGALWAIQRARERGLPFIGT
jgi:CTP synthase (UTP-ammonia lyase)